MKKSILSAMFFLAACLLHPASCSAQSPVNVTATVVDPSGIPYANATVSILLLPVGGATVGGNQILTTNNGLLDSNGKLNVSLYKNSDISPGGSTWQFTICETPGIAPPLGTGGVCFTSAQTVSAAVSFSTQFQAAAKALTTIPIGGEAILGGITATQVAFGSATNTLAGSANLTWNNTTKSLTATNTGLNGVAPLYGLASGVTVNEAGIVGSCQQLANSFCEGGQFTASDSGAGPIGSVIGVAAAPSHLAAGTLGTLTGVDASPTVAAGTGAITTSRGIHVGGIAFPTGTSPTTHDGIIVDDQCSGSFPATTCTGIRVATQSGSNPGVQSPSVALVSITVSALPAAAAGNKGQMRSVSDSTAVVAEGQTCVGGSTNTALAFSNGTVWKCF